MGKSTFPGGIHTYDGKNLSKDKPTRVLLPKGNLVFPLVQHIGAPAKPIVAKGDKVLVGQKIAEAGGFISANIISSVSGTVKEIEKRLTVQGNMVESIVIENDNEYQTIEGFGKERDYTKLTKDEIRNIVKEAGIVGLGGAGFPTHVKLTPKDDSKIDYVIVNGAECEPYLTSDYRMMLEEPEAIIGGLKIMLQLFEKAKGIIAVEDNKPDAIQKLRELTAKESRIEVRSLKTKYPQGGERQLVYAVTGRKLNSKKLPSDVGCVVDNVDTVISIYMAVARSTPLIRRIVTVTGDAVKTPQNFNVAIGIDYGELIEAAGGFIERPEKIISGGPMMGTAIYSTNVPVTKITSAITAFLHDQAAVEESPCIRCGKCVQKCPLQLMPYQLAALSNRSDEEGFTKLDGLECCGCGCCSYVCPAKRSLSQSIMHMRSVVMAKKKKA
ncbi:electron transport complex subunit RsxC [Lachnospiraceae bacterium MD1]|jgi:electron transport complex protein RnfC|uniref:Ion-translocating oxidoreductase complex subunit C n=1 Tax=Variimorphobacter saccharofermentans TaxID=2755051 RepID=A0A839K392_9FIRM|nr:electron transport complex subunit RsxC [Variimorphobacter saccharofermentans]MBB2184324.1 electron transport complex subunit RsxC [Variimorphobacter saccharofermentans]